MNKVQLPSSSFRIYERVENKGRNVNVNGKIKLFVLQPLLQKKKMKRNFLHKIKRRYLSVEEKEKRNETLKTNNSYSQYISQLHLGSMRLKPFST